jgi:membrane protease YdiL (CAAX protease family)
VIAAVFLVLQFAIVLWAVVSRNENLSASEIAQLLESAAQDGYLFSLTTFVTTVVCCALILGVIKLKKHSLLKDYLAIRAITLGTMLRWLGLLAVIIILSDVTTSLLGRPIVPSSMSALYATANPVWMIWVALIIAAPLFEETFFRGFLFRGLESSFLGTVGAVCVTAGLWAVIHLQYDAYGIATIFCLGLLLGAARAYTDSLLVPLGLHSAANLVAGIEAAVLG